MGHLKGFVLTCRDRAALLQELGTRAHLLNDVHFYSLDDLLRLDELDADLGRWVDLFSSHVLGCELCRWKGHICPVCDSHTTIYPFQEGTSVCPACGSCYHAACFTPNVSPCSLCDRRRVRSESATSSSLADALPAPGWS